MPAALSQTSVTLPVLPDGASFTLAIRRAVRSGDADGNLIEDMGFAGQPYDMTETDIIEGNRDLLENCASLLVAQPTTPLKARYRDDSLTLQVLGLDVAAVHVDGLPGSLPVSFRGQQKTSIDLKVKPGQVIDVAGSAQGVVRQRRRLFM